MSLPIDMIRRSILSTALSSVSTVINAVPGGKYVLIIGTAAATGAYFWGGTVWNWIRGTQPNPMIHLPQPNPPAESSTNRQPKRQDQVEPEKYMLLHQAFYDKGKALFDAWKKLVNTRNEFISQYGKNPSSLSDAMLGTLSVDHDRLQQSISLTCQGLSSVALLYKNGDAQERASHDLKVETKLMPRIHRWAGTCIENTRKFEYLNQDITREYQDKENEKLSSDQNAKLVEELKAKLAALNAKGSPAPIQSVSPNPEDDQDSSPSYGSSHGE